MQNEFSGVFSEELSTPLFNESAFTEIEELKEGGLCRIFRAKRHGQWWSLKCLKEEYVSQPFYISLLKKEYGILSYLQHPSVVRAVALEQVDGIGLCIVEEYISGVTLDKVKAPRSMRRTLYMQLLDCMEYVHSQQVVHRDLKPQNILVTHNGKNIKIVDFGLADTDNYDILKQPAGTPDYASPEQKSTPLADVRNDIYSLGIILRNMRLGLLYKLVTRRCLCDIKERYQNVATLKEGMNKVRMMYWFVLTIFTTFFVVLYFLVAPHKSYPQADPVELQEIPKQDTAYVAPQPLTEVTTVEESEKPSLYDQAYAASTLRIDALMVEYRFDSLLSVIDNMQPKMIGGRMNGKEYDHFVEAFNAMGVNVQSEAENIIDEWRITLTSIELSSLHDALLRYLTENYFNRVLLSIREYDKRKQEYRRTMQADGKGAGTRGQDDE